MKRRGVMPLYGVVFAAAAVLLAAQPSASLTWNDVLRDNWLASALSPPKDGKSRQRRAEPCDGKDNFEECYTAPCTMGICFNTECKQAKALADDANCIQANGEKGICKDAACVKPPTTTTTTTTVTTTKEESDDDDGDDEGDGDDGGNTGGGGGDGGTGGGDGDGDDGGGDGDGDDGGNTGGGGGDDGGNTGGGDGGDGGNTGGGDGDDGKGDDGDEEEIDCSDYTDDTGCFEHMEIACCPTKRCDVMEFNKAKYCVTKTTTITSTTATTTTTTTTVSSTTTTNTNTTTTTTTIRDLECLEYSIDNCPKNKCRVTQGDYFSFCEISPSTVTTPTTTTTTIATNATTTISSTTATATNTTTSTSTSTFTTSTATNTTTSTSTSTSTVTSTTNTATSTTSTKTTTTTVPSTTEFPAFAANSVPGNDLWRLTGLFTFESSTVDAEFLRGDGTVQDVMKDLLQSLSIIALAEPERVWITNAFSSVARTRRAGNSVSATYMSYQIDITTPIKAMVTTVESNIAKTFVDMRTTNSAFQPGTAYADITFTSGTAPTIVKGVASVDLNAEVPDGNQVEFSAASEEVERDSNLGPIIGGSVVIVALMMIGLAYYRSQQEDAGPGMVGAGGFGRAGSVKQSKTVTKVNNAMFGFGSAQKTEEVKVRKNSVKQSVKRSFKKNEKMKPSKDALSVARSKENEEKNRYKDMLPYNHNRVLLLESGESETDYINASFVPKFDARENYIVCQSPMENTINDFVEMVWQQESDVIVMLTEQENAFTYVDDVGKPKRFGELSVTQMQVDVQRADYVISTLRITHGKSGKKRMVKHCQYLTWPSSEVPETPAPFAEFRLRVLALTEGSTKPMVVHDASGCGQSACFVCVDRELERFDAEGIVDIFQTVSEMRKSRSYMVLSAEQYLFIHQTIFHSLMHSPFVPPEELELDVQHFVKHYKCPKKFKGFDLGANGRKFLSLGHFSLVGRAKGRQALKEVVVVVCTDVILVCEEGQDRDYHMISAPINREMIGAVDVQHSWDEPLFKVSSEQAQYVLEADTTQEKKAWIDLINQNPNYIPTDELQGPRLVKMVMETREDVANVTGLLDPFAKDATKELTDEFSVIPQTGVLDEKYLEFSEEEPTKGGNIKLVLQKVPEPVEEPQEISFFEYRRRDSLKVIAGAEEEDAEVDDEQVGGAPKGRRQSSFDAHQNEQTVVNKTGFNVVKFKAPSRSAPTSPLVAEEEEMFDEPDFEEEEEEKFDNPEFDEGGVAETSFIGDQESPQDAPAPISGFQMKRVSPKKSLAAGEGYLAIGREGEGEPTNPMSVTSVGRQRRTSQFSETLLGQSAHGHEVIHDANNVEARRKRNLAAAYGLSVAPPLAATHCTYLGNCPCEKCIRERALQEGFHEDA